jgi:hypothetical protein
MAGTPGSPNHNVSRSGHGKSRLGGILFDYAFLYSSLRFWVFETAVEDSSQVGCHKLLDLIFELKREKTSLVN